MIAIDSNTWIYYLDPTLREHKYVNNYIENIIIGKEDILTSTIIWLEVSHYLFKVSPISKEKSENILRMVFKLASMYVMDFDKELYLETIKIMKKLRGKKGSSSIGGRDCSIIAMMKKMNTNTIITHDYDFKRIRGNENIQIIDPIPS